jgi:hypothetical protein
MRSIAATTLAIGALSACSSSHALSPTGGGGSGGAAAGHAGSMGGSGGSGGATSVINIDLASARNVDVVFMVDDSPGMAAHQAGLVGFASAYFDVLKALPGGLPNIHVGVVSSSMGAGRNPSIDQCPPGGDQGAFHTKPLGYTCGKAMLTGSESFISNVDGQANYAGDIADMFSCIAMLGSGGCGFEHQLASVVRALGADGAPPPAQNANFLRPDAYLQIILLTDEDDCSAPPNSELFDSTSVTVTDPLGPLQSYRCNEFGHLCDGRPPPRQPMGEVDLSGTCVSAEDGRLLRVSDVVAELKHVKADPNKVFVAAITGPPNPYKVNIGPSQIKGDPSMWPYVEHACTLMAPDNVITYADPSVRLGQFVDAFGPNGMFQSICSPAYGPAQIAGQIADVLGAACFPANVDPDKCTFVDAGIDGSGNVMSVPLARCKDANDPGPCWDVGASISGCSQPIVIRRPGPPQGTSAHTIGTCAM